MYVIRAKRVKAFWPTWDKLKKPIDFYFTF